MNATQFNQISAGDELTLNGSKYQADRKISNVCWLLIRQKDGTEVWLKNSKWSGGIVLEFTSDAGIGKRFTTTRRVK